MTPLQRRRWSGDFHGPEWDISKMERRGLEIENQGLGEVR